MGDDIFFIVPRVAVGRTPPASAAFCVTANICVNTVVRKERGRTCACARRASVVLDVAMAAATGAAASRRRSHLDADVELAVAGAPASAESGEFTSREALQCPTQLQGAEFLYQGAELKLLTCNCCNVPNCHDNSLDTPH